MNQFKNSIHVEGYVFSHNLEKRVTGANSKNPGTEYIRGTLNVVTDEDNLNVVPVVFTYVTPVWAKSGKQNDTYVTLEQIIDINMTYEQCGPEATKVRVDGRLDVNDFLSRDGRMVEARQVSGSFCHIIGANTQFSSQRNHFEADVLIYDTQLHENEGTNTYLNLVSYGFNFNGNLIPITFSIDNPQGIKYFEDQNITPENPLLTTVWGAVTSTTVETEEKVENAWGEPSINVTTRTFRAWTVEGSSSEPMEFDSEATITRDELKEKIQVRANQVAQVKKRAEEARANSSIAQSGFPTATKNEPVGSPTINSDYTF